MGFDHLCGTDAYQVVNGYLVLTPPSSTSAARATAGMSTPLLDRNDLARSRGPSLSVRRAFVCRPCPMLAKPLTIACQNLTTDLSSVTWTAGNRNCGGTQMKQAYRVLAFLVAAGVALQAAAISYGMFGLIKWVERGGTLDQSTELTPALGGYIGFSWHATVGIFVLPVISLLFLITSFFAKVPGGIKWALIVFGMTVLPGARSLLPLGCRYWMAARHQRPCALRDRSDGRHARQPGGGQQDCVG